MFVNILYSSNFQIFNINLHSELVNLSVSNKTVFLFKYKAPLSADKYFDYCLHNSCICSSFGKYIVSFP